MEYLINLVGNYSIGWGITIIAALVFLVLCYRKVEGYFSDKAIHEKEKNEQFKKVMDQVNMYPSWHQQSIDIQKKFNKSIAELKEGMDQHQKQLEKIEEEEKEIFSAEFKEEISKLIPFSPVFINEIV